MADVVRTLRVDDGRRRSDPGVSGDVAERASPDAGLRIAYLVNTYPVTSGTFIRREIHALEERGVEVLRFSIRPPEVPLPTPADRDEAARTRVILALGVVHLASCIALEFARAPRAFLRALRIAARLGWRSDRGLLRHLAYLGEACVLRRWLRRDPVDHVHAHFATNPAAVALLCHELGGPTYSFTVHGPHEFDMPSFIGLGDKISRAAFVVAISSYGRSQLYRWSRYQDWPKIHVVRCGLPGDLVDAPPTEVPDVPRFVCIARLGEQKGHLVLVAAAARLAAEGIPLEMDLVGEGPMRAEIEREVRAHRLEGRVRLLGALSNEAVRDAILRARALVLPSFAEGLPVVLMESLALARPVICTAIAGSPELVEGNVSGWLVPAGSVERLAGAMREALLTPTARLSAMGRAGALRVARDHDVRREARRLAELFRWVVRGDEVRAEDAAAAATGMRASP